jgi:hypothetical protein
LRVSGRDNLDRRRLQPAFGRGWGDVARFGQPTAFVRHDRDDAGASIELLPGTCQCHLDLDPRPPSADGRLNGRRPGRFFPRRTR